MHVKYLKYVFRHKWFVFRECCRHGLYWRGLVHDLSKFRWSEWLPYAQYFYSDMKQHEALWAIGEFGCAELAPWGFYVKERFNLAWLFHQHRNAHHWQYWILRDGGEDNRNKLIPMPRKYAVEMYCDWVGAGLAITGKRDIRDWYTKNRPRMILHPETTTIIDELVKAENAEDAIGKGAKGHKQ